MANPFPTDDNDPRFDEYGVYDFEDKDQIWQGHETPLLKSRLTNEDVFRANPRLRGLPFQKPNPRIENNQPPVPPVLTATEKALRVFRFEKNFTQEQLKKRYKQFALKYHPDTSKEEKAEDKFKEIKEAYDLLKT